MYLIEKKGKFRQQFVEMAQEGVENKKRVYRESRSKAVDAVNKRKWKQALKQKQSFQNQVYLITYITSIHTKEWWCYK